jgi:TetR/AcrR family transcriptional repressor of nem operon
MRYDAEHKARTRERVLKEAAAAIRVEGPDRIGVADIMGRVGLTHGGFYAHFKSKDDLISQAIGYMFDERYASFLTRVVSTTDPRAALSDFIDWYLSLLHCETPKSGCPLPALAASLPRLPDEAQARFVAGAARLTEGVQALLERMGMDDADTLASSAISEMFGALSLGRAAPDEASADRLLEASRQSIKRRLGVLDS